MKRKTKGKKVLIINPEGSYYSNPTLFALGQALIKNGHTLKVLLPKNHLIKNDQTFIAYGATVRKIKTILVERLNHFNFDWLVAAINLSLLRESFDLVIGVDRQGIIEADHLCKLFNSKKCFVSFEIMFEDETSKLYKKREISACRDLCFWIIQDEVRAKLLCNENKLDYSSKIIVPVASASAGESKIITKSVRDELGIPKESKVAILMGSLSEMTLFEEVVHSVVSWPTSWVLLIHDKDGNAGEKLKKIYSKFDCTFKHRIFVSDNIIKEIADLGKLLTGVDAGIALYNATGNSKYLGKNIEYIGASSGKISTYTMFGVPVITNLADWHEEMIAKYGYGIKVDHLSGIRDALSFIEVNRNSFKDNALDFYKHHLDFRLYENKILDSVQRCLN